jgi:hypothetical protein
MAQYPQSKRSLDKREGIHQVEYDPRDGDDASWMFGRRWRGLRHV